MLTFLDNRRFAALGPEFPTLPDPAGISALLGPWYIRVMQVTHTAAGTPIVDFTPEEEAAYLERQVQREMGMSVAEFKRAYAAGEFRDRVPDVDDIVGLLRIGQNGQSPAA